MRYISNQICCSRKRLIEPCWRHCFISVIPSDPCFSDGVRATGSDTSTRGYSQHYEVCMAAIGPESPAFLIDFIIFFERQALVSLTLGSAGVFSLKKCTFGFSSWSTLCGREHRLEGTDQRVIREFPL